MQEKGIVLLCEVSGWNAQQVQCTADELKDKRTVSAGIYSNDGARVEGLKSPLTCFLIHAVLPCFYTLVNIRSSVPSGVSASARTSLDVYDVLVSSLVSPGRFPTSSAFSAVVSFNTNAIDHHTN